MRRLVLALLLFAPLVRAQSTLPDLQSRLGGRTMFLSGFWSDNHLKFDGAGGLVSKSAATSFTLAAFDIQKMALKPDGLVLEGRRMGLIFTDNAASRVDLHEHLKVEIAAPAGGDYGAALDAILVPDLVALGPKLPAMWQRYVPRFTGGEAPKPPASATPVPKLDIRAPRVLFAPEPILSDAAKARHYSGTVLVYLRVDQNGNPQMVSILRPAGMGLDEQAVLAVRGYRFKPAMDGDKPVTVEMNVEVNFGNY